MDARCSAAEFRNVEARVVNCRLCPRLVAWREHAAHEKTRRYRDQEYWGRPLPAFGDSRARMLIVGLAPAAHGGNRTGRMFTGDSSGDWLFRALHKAGFANQPTSFSREDGLALSDCLISATVRCAPPENKPTIGEIAACRSYLEQEIGILWPRLEVVVALGRVAFDWWIAYLRRRLLIGSRTAFRFSHLAEYTFERMPVLLCSFHPSRQNTQTGKLTEAMFDAVWQRAHSLLRENGGSEQ